MSQFSPHLPTLQIAWDQTSLGEFQFCPRKYYFTIIRGYVPAKEPVEFFFGRVYHSGLEQYDKAIALGASFADAQDAALAHTLEKSWGWEPDDNLRNRENLIRSVVWYTEKWRDAPIETLIIGGRPAVEVSFRVELPHKSSFGDSFILCGYFDAVVKAWDMILVRERKTTKSSLDSHYFATFSPNLQVTTYGYGSKIVLEEPARHILLDAAQIGVTFTDFGQHIISRTPSDYGEYERDVIDVLSRAELYAEQEYWPKNERNCWICPFKEVCRRPQELQHAALDADFAERTWNPLDIRE